MLADEIKKQINEKFEKSEIPLKINYLLLFRPVFHELPFENLEVIDNPKRFMVCNNVHMVITMNYEDMPNKKDYDFEVELRFVTSNGHFENEWCQVLTCDVFPGEDPEKIQNNLSQFAKMTGLLIVSAIAEKD